MQLSGIVAILLVGLLLRPDYIFGFLGTIATLAVIVLYVMANLALTAICAGNSRPNSTSGSTWWSPGSAPWPCSPFFFVTVYPEPSWPYNITPYCFS